MFFKNIMLFVRQISEEKVTKRFPDSLSNTVLSNAVLSNHLRPF